MSKRFGLIVLVAALGVAGVGAIACAVALFSEPEVETAGTAPQVRIKRGTTASDG